MRRPFAITAPATELTVDASGRGRIAFVVSNTRERPITARARLVAGDAEAGSWLGLDADGSFELPPLATRQIAVRLAVPETAPPAAHVFRLAVWDDAAPDEDYVTGPEIAFTVPTRTGVRRRRSWRWLAACAVVLLAAATPWIAATLATDGWTRRVRVPPLIGMTTDHAVAAMAGKLHFGTVTSLKAIPFTGRVSADGPDAPWLVEGPTASVVAGNLRTVVEDDWRKTRTIAGTRRDPTIAFPGNALGSPAEFATWGIAGTVDNWDNVSIQWDGWLRVFTDGTTLYTTSDDGSRVWLDLDHDGVAQPAEWGSNGWGAGQAATLGRVLGPLKAGAYRCRVQWEDGGGPDSIFLLWDDKAHGDAQANDLRIVPADAWLRPVELRPDATLGSVVSQDPPAGTVVPEGAAIDVVVHGGVLVPDLSGSWSEQAAALITASGLVVGTVTPAVEDAPGPLGSVLRQTPARGMAVNPGTAVDLVVLAGIEVPTLGNTTLEFARTAAQTLGFVLTIKPGDRAQAGLEKPMVDGQDPAPGTRIRRGAGVAVEVVYPVVPPAAAGPASPAVAAVKP